MLLEFWDFCRPQSIRTLPYVKAWHERYPDLKVIGVHAAGFPPSQDPDAVHGAVERLAIPYPVAIDAEYEVWNLYGNLGWPARYLFDQRGMLLHYHYGEGGYERDRGGDPGAAGRRAAAARAAPPRRGARRTAGAPVRRRRGPVRGSLPRRRGVGGARRRRRR